MEVSSNRGTPSHHPFLDGIFPHKPSSYWGTPMTMDTPNWITTKWASPEPHTDGLTFNTQVDTNRLSAHVSSLSLICHFACGKSMKKPWERWKKKWKTPGKHSGNHRKTMGKKSSKHFGKTMTNVDLVYEYSDIVLSSKRHDCKTCLKIPGPLQAFCLYSDSEVTTELWPCTEPRDWAGHMHGTTYGSY